MCPLDWSVVVVIIRLRKATLKHGLCAIPDSRETLGRPNRHCARPRHDVIVDQRGNALRAADSLAPILGWTVARLPAGLAARLPDPQFEGCYFVAQDDGGCSIDRLAAEESDEQDLAG
jgi:hypothetical protein